jgi:hypothetical protein
MTNVTSIPAAQITGSQAIPKSTLPTGSVLQVVQGTYSTQVTTSAGPVDTGLSATITPLFSTSKVLVMLMQEFYLYGGGIDAGAIISLLRNGSSIISVGGQSIYVSGGSPNAEIILNLPVTYLDSPASTSALTYKTQSTATSSGTIATSWGGNLSTITLMEIAA